MLEGMGGDRRSAILAEIEALGPVLAGCIIERSTRCQTESCHCRADPPRLHGPYPTWTHRENGRQVTKSLSAEQAEALRPFLARDRRLHELVHELEAASIELIEQAQGITLGRQTALGKRRPKAGK